MPCGWALPHWRRAALRYEWVLPDRGQTDVRRVRRSALVRTCVYASRTSPSEHGWFGADLLQFDFEKLRTWRAAVGASSP